MIRRNILKECEVLFNVYPILFICGARGTGKSVFIRQLIRKYSRDFVFLDISDPALVNFSDFGDGKSFVFENALSLERIKAIIRLVLNKSKRPSILIIELPFTVRFAKSYFEEFSDFVTFKELTPFKLTEVIKSNAYLNFYKIRVEKGGLPNAFLSINIDEWTIFFKAYLKNMANEIFPQWTKSINHESVFSLLSNIISGGSVELNYSALAKKIGKTSVTVKNYISQFNNSGLMLSLNAWPYEKNTRLVKSIQWYFFDTGIMHYFLRFSSLDLYQPFIWRTFVFNEIKNSMPDDFSLFYYKTYENAEVDLLVSRSSKPIMAIVTSIDPGKKKTRGITQAQREIGAVKNFWIVPEKNKDILIKDFIVRDLYTFLEKDLN